MLIGFDGEAYESFQRFVDAMRGYGCTITLAGESFDAILIGSDPDAEDGGTVRFIRVVDEDYEIPHYPDDAIESAVVDRIQIT